MKRKDKKRLIIIGLVVGSVILMSMVTYGILTSKENLVEEKPPGIEEYADVTIDFSTEDVMIEDLQTVYWNIGGPSNSTDVVLVTRVQIVISWSDDESAPPLRPMYTNQPDQFTLIVEGVPALSNAATSGNGTNMTSDGVARVTSTSIMGSTNADLNLLNNPIRIKSMDNATASNATGGWSWEPSGSDTKGDTGLFINITCVAGHIQGNRPALLRYNDPGDEITMNVKISYKEVPEEIVDRWVEQSSRKT